MNDLIGQRLEQAKQSLAEAQALLAGGMDPSFVLTSLYYAFYYPVLALVNEGRVPETMQSVILGLFEQRFVRPGRVPQKYHDAIRRVFAVKPTCSGEMTPVTREEMDALLGTARQFIADVAAAVAKDGKL
jgi:uncharacterized protein (UPF0332 family)